MAYSDQQDFKYYLSGIYQDIAVAVVIIILYLLIGPGIFADTGTDQGQAVVHFDTGVLLMLLFSLLVGSILFYFIFTRLKSMGIRVIYSFVLALPFVLFIFEIISLLVSNNLSTIRSILIFVIGVATGLFAILFVYIYGKGIYQFEIRNLGILLSSVIIGRIMALYFDLIGIVVFAIILSLFDIYSVFRGPLSKIMGEPQQVDRDRHILPPKRVMDMQFERICKEGTPVLLSYQNTLLGIGDVLFFSILMYNGLIEWQWIGLVVTLLMIMIGSSTTLFLLRKISPLPGLPLPVFFSLLGYGGLYLYFNLI